MQRWLLGAALLLSSVVPVPPAGLMAQDEAPPTDSLQPDTYIDPTAALLHRAASEQWWEIDESVRRYSARVQQRIAASIRAPLKDRVLYRNESAARVFWDRDHDTFVQVLGARAQYPGSQYADIEDFLEDLTIEEAFDPGGDRLVFGFATADETSEVDEDDFWIAHPLAPGADSRYQFRSGDTLTVRFPDGRELRTVELQVIPRRLSVHLISGALRIDPETGALVRAVYRLSEQFDAMRDIEELQEEEEAGSFRYVPGLFKPWTFDLKVVAVDYALWNFEVWLPRSMRVEGQAGAGILKFPVEMDIAYRMENVVLESDLGTPRYENAVLEERHFATRAEAMAFLASLMTDDEGITYAPLNRSTSSSGRTSRYLAPEDPSVLRESSHLPPPIWEEAPGFASEEELAGMFADLADIPMPSPDGIPWRSAWGFQRPDLVRYNRVEGPAVGARFEAKFGSFMGPIDLRTTGFFGVADLDPKVRLDLRREGLRTRWTLGAHRDIRAFDPRRRHLEFGNSLQALLWGRDEGEYYRATGVDLTLDRSSTERQSWRLRAWAERHDALQNESSFALTQAFDSDWRFRPNIQADAIEEVGGEIALTPWWGDDPLLPQVGLELQLLGAGYRLQDDPDLTDEYLRARAIVRTAIPLAGARWRLGLEAGAGTSWGNLPVQRSFVLGGAGSLRGYDASVAWGDTFGRGRLEIARVYSGSTLSFFGDGGWAGARDEARCRALVTPASPCGFDADDLLFAIGVGGSVLDGLIRMDLSRGLTRPFKRTRLDLYLDAIL